MNDHRLDLLTEADVPADDGRCCICGSERPPGYFLLCEPCAEDSEVRAVMIAGIAERLRTARLALEATYTARL